MKKKFWREFGNTWMSYADAFDSAPHIEGTLGTKAKERYYENKGKDDFSSNGFFYGTLAGYATCLIYMIPFSFFVVQGMGRVVKKAKKWRYEKKASST